MKLTRAIFLAAAFLIPAVSTVAKAADEKPAAGDTAAPAEGKKAKKAKKGKKATEEKKDDAAGAEKK